MHRVVAVLAAATLAAGVSAAFGAAPAGAADARTAGAYVPVTPVRAIDRTIGAHGTFRTSRGVPSGAAAVVVSISVSGATRSGAVVASSPSSGPLPTAATVSFAARQNVGDLAIVPVAKGRIELWNDSAGRIQVIGDVSGYYTAGSPTAGGAFHVHAGSAERVVDTRHGTDGNRKGAVRSGATINPHIAGLGGVPTDAGAVAATITVVGATASGTVSVRTSGGDSVPASLQVQAGRAVSQLLVLPLSAASGGKLAIANHTGKPVHLTVDVSGYYLGGAPNSASVTQAVEASSVVSQSIGANKQKHILVAGRGGVPRAGAVAAIVTLRVVRAATYGTVSAASGAAPAVVQFSTGSTRSGVIIARLDSSGRITVANHAKKKTKVQIDVDGYVPGTAVAAPAASRSHYLRVDDASQMTQAGTADGQGASRFVVLDLGAQSNDRSGVVLSATNTEITYDQVAELVGDYVSAYAAQSDTAVTVAVATNNSGDFSAFGAAGRSRRWAQLLTNLRSENQFPNVTLVAADDIEAGFEYASTESQAQTWEDDFVAALPVTTSIPTDLYFIGSADGCPTTFGRPAQTCAHGWTEAQYLRLAGGAGVDAGRVQALPQVYLDRQAVQWANIAATAGGGVATIEGSLTEHAACPTTSSTGCSGIASMTATDGFVALYRSLSSVATPHLTFATDLDIID